MKPSDFKAITAEILANLSDQGKVSQLLSQLNETYETTHTTHETTTTELGKKDEEIRSLQATNMNLFLKVGNPIEPTDKLDSVEPLTFDKLIEGMEGNK